ncbi:MAG: DUF3047 domain-containing protein [Rhodospirillales bacterium]|nr:DUF3047 domain-containing protein [Rhodospirillales bacterium]
MQDQGSKEGRTKRARILRALAAVPLACFAVVAAAQPIALAPADMLAGKPKAFSGETRYELTRVNGRDAVWASCDASASGLVLERRIDLRKTPIIEWSWGVAAAFDTVVDERRKAGDDYPARLYFVHDGGFPPWRTRAINYVWASHMPVGTDWPNAYLPQSRVVAVQSGRPDLSMPWVMQRRNLRVDFQRYFDVEVDFIDAVAIMTDCDDRAEMADAWYGTVRFLPEGGE